VRIHGQIQITEPQTAKSKRFVPISIPAEHLLRRMQANQAEERSRAGSAWRQTGFVFTTEFGEPGDPRNALRALKAAATKAGLPDVGLHTLRHSAASVMLTHGVPHKVVSEISATHRSRSPATSTDTSLPTSGEKPLPLSAPSSQVRVA
jgi:integrase